MFRRAPVEHGRRRRPSIAEHRRRTFPRIVSRCKLGRLKQFDEEQGLLGRRPSIAEHRRRMLQRIVARCMRGRLKQSDERRRYSRRAEERRPLLLVRGLDTWLGSVVDEEVAAYTVRFI